MNSYDLVSALRASMRERARSRSLFRAFSFGVLVCFLLTTGLLVAYVANAQVPGEALKYKRELIRNARAIWGMDAPTANFAAQIHQESLWQANAKSRVGALGMAQFMPATADWISGAYGYYLGDNQPLNPAWAIKALVTYNRHLFDRVAAANKCEQLAFAMSAYNGGLGWVNRRKKLSEDPLVCFGVTCEINPGITEWNQRENSEYPKRILLKHTPSYVASNFGQTYCP